MISVASRKKLDDDQNTVLVTTGEIVDSTESCQFGQSALSPYLHFHLEETIVSFVFYSKYILPAIPII